MKTGTERLINCATTIGGDLASYHELEVGSATLGGELLESVINEITPIIQKYDMRQAGLIETSRRLESILLSYCQRIALETLEFEDESELHESVEDFDKFTSLLTKVRRVIEDESLYDPSYVETNLIPLTVKMTVHLLAEYSHIDQIDEENILMETENMIRELEYVYKCENSRDYHISIFNTLMQSVRVI